MSDYNTPGIVATRDIYAYLAVGEDKGAAIIAGLGLPLRREHDWTTVWAALGLAPVQRRKVWDHLQVPLICVTDVAAIISKAPKTISGWCREGEYPPDFPVPFDFGPRTRRWIALEIWAYRQPAIYGALSGEIVRPKVSSRKLLQPAGPLPVTLDPLPFS